jgi:hypothetical protein
MRPDVLAESLAVAVKGLLEPIVAALERSRASLHELQALHETNANRLEGYTAMMQRDLGAALDRIAALEARGPEPGPAGPQGPAGPAGQDGAPGMEYLGTYVSGKSYRKGDTVTAGGSMFTCLRETTGSPGASRDWQLSVKHGQDYKPRGDRG